MSDNTTGGSVLLQVLCQTCGAELVTDDKVESSEFMMAHVREFHRVTWKPLSSVTRTSTRTEPRKPAIPDAK